MTPVSFHPDEMTDDLVDDLKKPSRAVSFHPDDMPANGRRASRRPRRKPKAGGPLRDPAWDLLPVLDQYLNRDSDDGPTRSLLGGDAPSGPPRFDVQVKAVRMPSITLAVLEAVYEREIPMSEQRKYPVAALVTLLLHEGLLCLQSEPSVIAYRQARREAIGDVDETLGPAARVTLRQWMKSCSYTPPAAHGGTEDYVFRSTVHVSALAGGLAKELGILKGYLIAASVATSLSDLPVTETEYEALTAQWDALVDEIDTRCGELTRRLKRVKGEGK